MILCVRVCVCLFVDINEDDDAIGEEESGEWRPTRNRVVGKNSSSWLASMKVKKKKENQSMARRR